MADQQRRTRVSRRGFFRDGGLAAVAMGAAGAWGAREAWAQAAPPPAQVAIADQYAFGDGIKRIKAAKKVVFAMSGSSIPPQYYRDPTTNQPAGYDVEVAKLIAKDLGVDPVFEEAVVAAAGEFFAGLVAQMGSAWCPVARHAWRTSFAPTPTRRRAAPTSPAARCWVSGGGSLPVGASWSARRPAARRWR